jgi:hypothetical protein
LTCVFHEKVIKKSLQSQKYFSVTVQNRARFGLVSRLVLVGQKARIMGFKNKKTNFFPPFWQHAKNRMTCSYIYMRHESPPDRKGTVNKKKQKGSIRVQHRGSKGRKSVEATWRDHNSVDAQMIPPST